VAQSSGASREEAQLRLDAFSAAVDTRIPCRGTGLRGNRGGSSTGLAARGDVDLVERRHGWRRAAAARVGSNRAVDSIWGSNDLTDGSHL
jgi:hypothetical protein